MAGEVASLYLSRMTLPVLFYLSERKKHDEPPIEDAVVAELSCDANEIPEAETAAEESNGQPANVTLVESPIALEDDAAHGDVSLRS